MHAQLDSLGSPVDELQFVLHELDDHGQRFRLDLLELDLARLGLQESAWANAGERSVAQAACGVALSGASMFLIAFDMHAARLSTCSTLSTERRGRQQADSALRQCAPETPCLRRLRESRFPLARTPCPRTSLSATDGARRAGGRLWPRAPDANGFDQWAPSCAATALSSAD